MEVLKQCQKWFEQNEIQKVIDALEAIPSEERTPGTGLRAGKSLHHHRRGRRTEAF